MNKLNALTLCLSVLGFAACTQTKNQEPSSAPQAAVNAAPNANSPNSPNSNAMGAPAVADSPTPNAPANAAGNPAPGAVAAANPAMGAPTRNDADNTRLNARDRNSAAPTPLDQGGSEADRTITQNIRKSVVGASDLSMTAKNVKIITQSGNVTLRGPVKSLAERTEIESKAKQVPGVSQVDNQLEVKQ